MKASFIVEIDTEDDLNLPLIAEELKDTINENFPYACLSAKPFPHPALGVAAPTVGGPIPPQQNIT